MIRFKLKLAIRNLLKNKVYSSLIIGGFAIGFAAFILISSFYNAEHNVDKQFKNYENIYRVYDAKLQKYQLDYELSPALSEHYPEIKETCPVEYSPYFEFTIKDRELKTNTRIKYSMSTTNEFFNIFSVDVVAKSADKPFASPNSAVISESAARKLFGNENPLGRTIEQEYFSAVISAVIKDFPENSSFKADLLLNAENEQFHFSQECNNGVCVYPVEHFLVLDNTTAPLDFAEKLNKSITQYNTNVDSLALQNLASIYLSPLKIYDNHAKGNPRMLIVFLSIAILIILLSSINYLNYVISMQYAKLKEIGINKTNGADKWSLIGDSFIEVALGISISLIISILITILFLPYSESLFGRTIQPADINFGWLVPVVGGTVLGIVLLNSLAPIYVLSRFNVREFLAGGKQKSGKQIGKQTMQVFQLTVSIALIAVVMLIFKQLQYVKHHDLGFDEQHLVRLELPYLLPNPETVKNETAKLPFVTSATLSDGYPGGVKLSMGSGLDDNFFDVQCIHVSDNYLKTMGIQLLDGRTFLPGDKKKACLMNEAAIKKFEWNSLENKTYDNGNPYQVVGMVNDFNVQSLHAEIPAVALIYDPDHQFETLSLRLNPGNISQQIADLRKVWKTILPDEPMEFTFYDSQFQAMYQTEEKLGKSIAFFSFIAIALTCMGILGQIFLISINRTKEIGIRKVNGAKISEVLAMLNKDFVKWVAIAFILATPIAWFAMNKWLENFAYKTELSWWIFALSGFLTMGIALLTVSWQSWKAATRNPVEALRYE